MQYCKVPSGLTTNPWSGKSWFLLQLKLCFTWKKMKNIYYWNAHDERQKQQICLGVGDC